MPDENDTRTELPAQTNNSWSSGLANDQVSPEVEPATTTQDPNTLENDTTTGVPGSGLAFTEKQSNKKLLVAAVCAGVGVVLLGSGVAAYNVWYQNPQKVVTDALANVLKAETLSTNSKITVESGATEKSKYTIGIDAVKNNDLVRFDVDVSSKASGSNFDISGSLIAVENKKLYIKVNELKSMLEKSGLLQLYGSSKAATSLIDKLDSNWIAVTQADADKLRGAKSKSTECTENAVDKLNQDKSYSAELEKLYREHPLIGIRKELGSNDNDLGYEIGIDKENAVTFANGMNQTKFFKDVQKCDDTIKPLNGSEIFKDYKPNDSATIAVWIDRWSHTLTKLEIKEKSDKTTLNGVTTFTSDKPVKIEEPKNSLSIDEVQKELDAVEAELMQSYESTSLVTY